MKWTIVVICKGLTSKEIQVQHATLPKEKTRGGAYEPHPILNGHTHS